MDEYLLQLKVEMEDRLSAKIAPVVSKLEAAERKMKKPKILELKAVDKASKVLDFVRAKANVVKDKKLNMEIKARTAQAEKNLQALKKAKADVARDARLKIRADSSTAKAHLKRLNRAKKEVQKDVRFKARADVQQAQSNMSKLNRARKALTGGTSIKAMLLDMATKGLMSIGSLLKKMAKGLIIPISVAGVRARKRAIEGLGKEQTQKITINRVIQNAGNSKAQARKKGAGYYKYLRDYSMKTPFTPEQMATMGTKAMMMEKGNIGEAKKTTDLMANVKSFVGDMRTEQEVAEAFFSASTGNLESLNNMLGSQYKTFEEAKAGIAKNQGGLVDELAETIPGKISTLKGMITMGLVDMLKPFEGLMSGALDGVIGKAATFFTGIAETITTNMPAIEELFGRISEALSPLGDMFNDMFTNISTGAPESMGLFQIFGEVAVLVAQLIGGAVEVLRPVIEGLFTFIGENAPLISGFLRTMGQVAKVAFKVMSVATKGAWTVVQPILSSLMSLVESVAGAFKGLYDAAKSAWDFLTNHNFDQKAREVGANSYAGLKMATGYNRIPRDDFPARLHEGERVLNRVEADNYERGSSRGVSIAKLAETIIIREEADIDKIIDGFNRKIRIATTRGVV